MINTNININERIKERLISDYQNGNWSRISEEEYISCQCRFCTKQCIHKDAFRRYPMAVGGLGLCENLK